MWAMNCMRGESLVYGGNMACGEVLKILSHCYKYKHYELPTKQINQIKYS